MANVHTTEFQKLWSIQIESVRRLEYEDTIQQHPEANGVMERVLEVLIPIARLTGCTHASVGESPKWALIVQNMMGTRISVEAEISTPRDVQVGVPQYSVLSQHCTVYKRAIRKVISREVLTKQAMRKKLLYTKYTYMLKLYLNVVTAGPEALFL
jgi:hypothetical protein